MTCTACHSRNLQAEVYFLSNIGIIFVNLAHIEGFFAGNCIFNPVDVLTGFLFETQNPCNSRGKILDSRLKIAGMTRLTFARHAIILGNSSLG